MLPPDERLVSGHAARREPGDWLIVENERAGALFAIDRPAKLGFELEPSQRGDVHLRLERCGARFALRLRAIQREVRVAQYVVRTMMRQQ